MKQKPIVVIESTSCCRLQHLEDLINMGVRTGCYDLFNDLQARGLLPTATDDQCRQLGKTTPFSADQARATFPPYCWGK